ncbi:MAG: SGNH/GDSL hydrolase family protein [Rhodothermaceae bacterium]|nr:SGNH/GDSL hydrolase family protein [Rhodothermaceae bacterium]
MIEELLTYLPLFWSVTGLVLFSTALYYYSVFRVRRKPVNDPNILLRSMNGVPGKRLVACIGDSNTHGNSGFNYVNWLKSNLESSGLEFCNAGYNSDLAWNVLQRLNPVIALNPEYIIIMVGTNDVIASLTRESAESYMQKKDLPQQPNSVFFTDSYRLIINHIREECNARIAVVSIPVIGENPGSVANQKAAAYNTLLKDLAYQYDLDYLPVFDEQISYLRKQGVDPRNGTAEESFPITRAMMMRYILGISWDKISSVQGLYLTTDKLHMNSTGGKMIASRIEHFLTRSEELRIGTVN